MILFRKKSRTKATRAAPGYRSSPSRGFLQCSLIRLQGLQLLPIASAPVASERSSPSRGFCNRGSCHYSPKSASDPKSIRITRDLPVGVSPSLGNDAVNFTLATAGAPGASRSYANVKKPKTFGS